MVAFDMLAFGIIAPVLPDLIRNFEGGDFVRPPALAAGLALLGHHAIYFFADSWRVVGPFWPAPVMLISCFGWIDYVIMALAPSPLRSAIYICDWGARQQTSHAPPHASQCVMPWVLSALLIHPCTMTHSERRNVSLLSFAEHLRDERSISEFRLTLSRVPAVGGGWLHKH